MENNNQDNDLILKFEYLYLGALITDKKKLTESVNNFTDKEVKQEKVWEQFKEIFKSDTLQELLTELDTKKGWEIKKEYGDDIRQERVLKQKQSKLFKKVDDLIKQSGYKVEWENNKFIPKEKIKKVSPTDKNTDKNKIKEVNKLIKDKNLFHIEEFCEHFGYEWDYSEQEGYIYTNYN